MFAVVQVLRSYFFFLRFVRYRTNDDNPIIVHQNNQADLENATEVLSGYLERDISQDSLQDIKQKVQDKYRSVKEELY